jgi:2-oxoglutarate dehydrogenase E2 component (dihydrolipoamide succinyltransferase)
MAEIKVPRLNSNDDTYTRVEWLVGDEQPIEPDESVATVETSKATEDLLCPAGGVLWQAVPAGTACAPGTVIGRVVAPGTARDAPAGPPEPAAAAGGPVVTRPAQALIDAAGIDPERVRALGLKVVRRADVEPLAGTPAAPDSDRLPAHQRAVARTVTVSHRTIPAAYTVVAVDAGPAIEAAAEAGRRLRQPVGLPELLVAAAGRLPARFPRCFATPGPGDTLRYADDAHIGVTIDAGEGLFVPVVSHASRRSLDEIVALLAGFRRTARRGRFREDELAGGNLTVALHHEPDLVLAIPLVHPGQVCSLALTGARPQVVLDGEGRATSRTVTNLGLAYDHRFVNGREASRFLHAVKAILEEGP